MNLPVLRREFNRLLNPIYDRLGDLDRRLRAKASIRSATVTSVDPVRIQFDGDTNPVASAPDTLVPVGPGDRVRVLHHGGTQYTIAGVVGGGSVPFAMAAGVVTIPDSSSDISSVPVAFPAGKFTVPPAITATPGNTNYSTYWNNRTSAGVNIGSRRVTGGGVGSHQVTWTAVQMTPTSAEG